eukprot:5578546-Prymnesium_polylepis.1
MRIKEGERKNKAAVPLSRIELIVLGLDAPASTTTARRRRAPSSIRTASFAGTAPEQNRAPDCSVVRGHRTA